MSNIFTLIKTLCPNGVEYKALGDLLEAKAVIIVNAPFKLQKSEYKLTGQYPIIDQGQIFISGFNDDDNYLIEKDEYVIFGDHTENLKYVDFAFIQGADGIKILKTNKSILKTKFLFYAILRYYNKSGKYTRHFSFLRKTLIPLPPLEVQEEIVRILDKYTEVVIELKEKLAEELVLRKKQYEYYRNKLLTPIEKDGKHYLNGKEVEWKTLGEVLEYEQPTKYIVNSTNYNDDYKTPVLTAGQTFILGHTNEKENIFNADEDNPVIIFDDFTTSFHWVNFNFKVKSSAMKILKIKNNIFNNINFKYCYYAMKCINYIPQEHARQWISKYSTFPIPIPPIEEQERIVKILDKFDALVNDLSEGIPAEIEARTKQYEYYRNKLLRFE